jgi:hypothetical protein
MAQRFCTNCGQSLPENARFCAGCGTAVAGAQATPQQPPAAAVPPVATPPAAPPPVAVPPPPVAHPPVAVPLPVAPPPPVYQAPPQAAYQPPPAYQAPPQPAYQPPPPAYQQPPVQYAGIPGETLIGIIPSASRKKNLFTMESFNIIVTNQRMIFAQMTNEMIKAEAATYKGQGIKGVFKAMGAGGNIWQRYQQMPPDQALAETPGNFGLYLNQVRKVKYTGTKVFFNKGGVSMGLNIGFGGGDDDDNNNAKLQIETIGGKYEFEIIMQFQQQTYQVLKTAGLVK